MYFDGRKYPFLNNLRIQNDDPILRLVKQKTKNNNPLFKKFTEYFSVILSKWLPIIVVTGKGNCFMNKNPEIVCIIKQPITYYRAIIQFKKISAILFSYLV